MVVGGDSVGIRIVSERAGNINAAPPACVTFSKACRGYRVLMKVGFLEMVGIGIAKTL